MNFLINIRYGFFILIFLNIHLYAGAIEKFKIKDVIFAGNQAYSQKRLHKVMVSRPSSFLNPSYYYAEVFKDDLRDLELFYRQNGYLNAKITEYQIEIDSLTHEVLILIGIEENTITYVEGVEIFGNDFFPDPKLREKIEIRTGEPLQSMKVEAATLSLLRYYADNGYLDARVIPEIRVNEKSDYALINFNIKEGIVFRIDSILIKGLEKTRSHVVQRELRFKRNDTVNYSHLLESQRQLYLTGLFQSVNISPQPAARHDSTRKDIIVELKEVSSGEFNVALGYGSVEKLRGRIEIVNNNLQGSAKKIGFTLRMNFINQSGEISFSEPWTFGTRLRTDLIGGAENLNQPGYDLNRIGAKLTFGRALANKIVLSGSYRYEQVDYKNVYIDFDLPEGKKNISSIILSAVFDNRNNIFFPTKGTYLEFSSEFSGYLIANTANFTRYIARAKYFYALRSSTILASAMDIGWIDARDGIANIPLNERFYAGGPASLRGFEYQRVGPRDENGLPLGGLFKFVWNLLEVRQDLYKMIGGVIFMDIGNVWTYAKDFGMNDLRIGAGLGLRVNTPIGLISLDYGYNLNQRSNEPIGKFYFNMGHTF